MAKKRNEERRYFIRRLKLLKFPIICIDPGKQGCIVSAHPTSGVLKIRIMPDTPQEIQDYISNLKGYHAIIEKVQGLPKMGGSSMFNFGRNYQSILSSLYFAKIPTEEITPQKWMKEIGAGTKKSTSSDSDTVWKNRLKQKAQFLFPEIDPKEITLAISDSLLILQYGIEKYMKS